jgi:hypothetical protein
MNRIGFVLCISVVCACSGGKNTQEPVPQQVQENTSLVVRQIKEASDVIGGPDAVGGLGDWYLSNGVVEAIVDDVHNQNGTAPGGGTLVDFAYVGMDNDQFNQMFQVFMVSQDLPVLYETATPHVGEGFVSLEVSGYVFAANPQGALSSSVASLLKVTTEYTMYPEDPSLHVRTVLTNHSSVEVLGDNGTPLSDIFVWGKRSLEPFAPYRGRGFEHPPLDVRNPVAALGGYLYVAARGELDPPVSYGVVAPSLKDALVVGVNTEQLSGLGQFPAGGALKPGAQLVYERRVLIGRERTVDSVASQAFKILQQEASKSVPALGTLEGRVVGLSPGRSAEIVAELLPNAVGPKPVNAVTVWGEGFFRMTLPVDTYQLRISFGAMEPVLLQAGRVQENAVLKVQDIPAPGMALLTYDIASDGEHVPARLTLRGAEGTRDPMLGKRTTGFVSGHVAYSVDGKGSVWVEPGVYDVYASRGLEYSLSHQRVVLAAGASERVDFRIQRVLNTQGMLAGDFHVHGAASFDSSVDPQSRVLSFAGEGVEVMVSTEHDVVVDYAPAAQALGVQKHVATVVGVESTAFVPTPQLPRTIGHNNVWPMSVDPLAPRRGSPRDERIEPGELYERLRAVSKSTPVVQLNHPRAEGVGSIGLGYFTNFDFRPNVPIPSHNDGGINSFLRRQGPLGTDNLGFDAMEVINGAAWESVVYSRQNRDDWLALLKQGFVRTGMANSDSHRVHTEAAGFPRTYVVYGSESPEALDVTALNEAVLRQAVMGTSGPFIRVFVGNQSLGETVAVADRGMLPVFVQVQAAPWIPVEQVRVLLNGKEVCVLTRSGDVLHSEQAECPGVVAQEPADPYGVEGVVRYAGTVGLNIAQDSFITVEAGPAWLVSADLDGDGVVETWDVNGDGSADAQDASLGGWPRENPPAVPNAVVPGLVPWGFTNPVFVDVGANGWTAPGL